MNEVSFPLVKSESRRALISQLWKARGGAKAIVALPVTKAEIRQTAKEVASVTRVDDEIRDEEQIGVVSSIEQTAPRMTAESESSILLESREKMQLRREVEAYRLAKRLPFAIVPFGFWNRSAI